MNKKKILILIGIFLVIGVGVYFLNQEERGERAAAKRKSFPQETGEIQEDNPEEEIPPQETSELQESSEENVPQYLEMGETTDFFDRVDATMIAFSKTDYNSFPAELITYFENALLEGKLIEKMEDIQAEYRVMGKEEKEAFDVPEEEQGLGVSLYYSSIKDDEWYCVSLSEEGDDIIAEHVGEDGCTVNYFFWNIMQWYYYGEVPLRAGGQKNSRPYFVEWEDKNYMAIPYWNMEGDEIIGVTIYKFYSYNAGSVLAIGINTDGTVQVTPQKYEVERNPTYFSEGATLWPGVVSY